MKEVSAAVNIRRLLIGTGLVLLLMAGRLTDAGAQQPAPKTEPIVLNFGAFIPGSHPEMKGFNKGFVAKAV